MCLLKICPQFKHLFCSYTSGICDERDTNAMPGTVMKGHLSSIEEKLSASLGSKKTDSQILARKLAAQSRSILLQKVDFVPAQHESSSYWKEVQEKYSTQRDDMNTSVQKPVLHNGIHKKLQKGSLLSMFVMAHM